MKKYRISNFLACLAIAGCLSQSSAAVNPLAPLFPDLEKIKMCARKQRPRPAPTRAPRLAKRTAPGTGAISGNVMNADASLSGLSPTVSVIDTFGWEVADPECDDSGFYSATGLYPGAYLVMAYADYTAEYSGDSSAVTYLGNTGSIGAAKWIHLSGGQSLSGQDIVIPPKTQSSQPKITVSGTCYGGSGTTAPLPGVRLTVTILPVDNNSLFVPTKSGYCTTAPDGAFACTLSAAPGSYYGLIKATGNDTAFVPQWWDGSAVTTEPVAVSAGPTITGKEIHLERGGSISGVIRDEQSDTLANAVEVFALDKDGYAISSDYCSYLWRDSTFFISGLPEGSWYLKVSSTGFPDVYGTTYYPQAGSLDAATRVNVTSGSSTQVRIVLKRKNNGDASVPGPKGSIKGRITRQDNGAPIPDYSVQFTSGSFLAYSTDNTTTDSLGNFSDSLTADSSYYVYTGNEMLLFGSTPEYYLTPTWYPGVTDQASAVKVKPTKGSTQTADIAVQQGGSIGGWVQTSTGTGFPNYMNGLYNSGEMVYGYAWTDDFSNVYTTYVGEVSGFRFCGVRPGSYTVRLITVNFSALPGAGRQNGTGHAFATVPEVVVTQENTALNRTLTVPDGTASITGTTGIDNQDNPVYSSLIYCYAADSIVAGYSAPWLTGPGPAKESFFNRDTPPPIPPARIDYTIGKLVPGKYALARLAIDTSKYEVLRQWYGTTTWEKFNLRELSEYYRQFLKPGIPSAAWLTLAAGEIRSGVNFGNIGVINRLNSNQAGNAELRLLRGTSRNVTLHYRLPKLDRNTNAKLAVYLPDGTLITTFSLNKPQGVITWCGKNDGNAYVSPGIYLYRLTGAGHELTVRGIWVR